MLACPDCGTELPATVVEALGFLYGGTVIRVDSLAGNLAWAIRESDRRPPTFTDSRLGEIAIRRFMDDLAPHTLIAAARHHERLTVGTSECGRAQTDRLAREDVEASRG